MRIVVDNNDIGYVNKGLVPTFIEWLDTNRILDAWVEKMNGLPGRPTAFLYVKISERRN